MRTSKHRCAVLQICWLLTLACPLEAGTPARTTFTCGTHASSPPARLLDEPGGIYLPSKGTLRILIVFASFPDDETPHPYWPAHQPPLMMQQFLDPDTTTQSHGTFNLTSYFDEMSLGQFHVVGDVVWMESLHSQHEFDSRSSGRANSTILQEQIDPLVDFSRYDHWSRLGPYQTSPVPDGVVDMIVMVWRTDMFEYLGEASLGYRPGFPVDGIRIEMGFPGSVPLPAGSGVTCEYPYGDSPTKTMRTMAHELGHWLLGGLHPYNGLKPDGKHQFWGILCSGERISSCANSYERERLGWITVPEIAPDADVQLADFVTTGAARKFHPPNGEQDEYFYIENHQLSSPFDDVTLNPADKGVWVVHQEGPYVETDNIRINPVDGNWKWESSGPPSTCFQQVLPVFRRGVPEVGTGLSHRDQIPTPASLLNWMLAYQEPGAGPLCGEFLGGVMFQGSFDPDSCPVFSPYSNPNSDTWNNQPTGFTMVVTKASGGILTVHTNSNPLDAPPARRYVGPDPSARGTPPGALALAWGSQWSGGQPLESDVVESQLQRRIGEGGQWETLYDGGATNWVDGGRLYESTGTVMVHFRVRVSDTQGKFSAWSTHYVAKSVPVTSVGDRTGDTRTKPDQVQLGANYPNPFNPTTNIQWTIDNRQWTIVRIYDVLGREVATLVNEVKEPGTYTVQFDARLIGGQARLTGRHLASGVYIYRISAGEYVASRKMVLMK